MKNLRNKSGALVVGALFASLMLAPAAALAQSHGHDRSRDHGTSHSQPPSQNGDRSRDHGDQRRPPTGHGYSQHHDDSRDHWQDHRNQDHHDWDQHRDWDRHREWDRHVQIHRYPVVEWRRTHPNWNGRYYYHSGAYYYDSVYHYPAQIDNEWLDIANIAGGISFLGALDNDPTLFFAGTAGELYSIYRYDEDLRSGDRLARLRAAYFARPYFWRDGVRYDRVIVIRNGERYYRFVRH